MMLEPEAPKLVVAMIIYDIDAAQLISLLVLLIALANRYLRMRSKKGEGGKKSPV